MTGARVSQSCPMNMSVRTDSQVRQRITYDQPRELSSDVSTSGVQATQLHVSLAVTSIYLEYLYITRISDDGA